MFDKDKFIEIIRAFMKKNNISQDRFAKKVGVELSSVSRWLSKTDKSTSIPRKKTIEKIAEIIGISQTEFYNDFDGDPFNNKGITDLELKKYSPGNALAYINLYYHDNNRFLEPSYKSDFDFEPIYKTEIDLVKKFLSINDNILFISSFNRNFSDYYIEQKKKRDYYFDSDFNLDAFENKWKDEINDNAIAKLTFLQEVNSILTDLSEYNLFVYANKSVHTEYVISNENEDEFIDDAGLYKINFENIELLISEIKYHKLTNVISKKNSENIIWPSPLINFSPEGLIDDKNINDTEAFFERFVRYFWNEVSNGKDIINISKMNKIKKKEADM